MPTRARQTWKRQNIGCDAKIDRWFYVFGFEKNERATVSAAELEALQILAEELLSRTDKDLDALMQTDKLIEMCYGYQN